MILPNSDLGPPPLTTPITAQGPDEFGVPFQARGLASGNLQIGWAAWFSGVWNRMVVLVDAVLGYSALTTVSKIPRVTAAGTLGNSSLSDNGTQVISPVNVDTGATPASSQFVARANALGALAAICYAADNLQIQLDWERLATVLVARNAVVGMIQKNAGKLYFSGLAGQTPGNALTAGLNQYGVLDFSTGFWRFGDGATGAYPVDSAGDIRAVGVYRAGALAGISTTIATAKLTALGVNGSMTFTGGILTASTPAT